jgi:hypothetical protein
VLLLVMLSRSWGGNLGLFLKCLRLLWRSLLLLLLSLWPVLGLVCSHRRWCWRLCHVIRARSDNLLLLLLL